MQSILLITISQRRSSYLIHLFSFSLDDPTNTADAAMTEDTTHTRTNEVGTVQETERGTDWLTSRQIRTQYNRFVLGARRLVVRGFKANQTASWTLVKNVQLNLELSLGHGCGYCLD